MSVLLRKDDFVMAKVILGIKGSLEVRRMVMGKVILALVN